MQYFYVWSFLQIVLESLPVSSSGNVILWLYLIENYLDTGFMYAINALDFDFLLHGPTLCIIGLYFAKDWIRFVQKAFGGKRKAFALLLYCAWADLLTGVWYAVFKAIGKDWFPLSLGFVITGLGLLSLWLLSKNDDSHNQELSLYHATLLGMVQGMALLPGLSRFAITYIAARYARYTPGNAFRYSFLIQVPLITAAFLKGCYSFYLFQHKAQLLHPLFGLTILISTIISYFALRWVGTLVIQKRIYLFGWYVLGLAGLAIVLGK